MSTNHDDDYRLCDKCDNFYIHPSGTVEYCNCHEKYDGNFDRGYTEERINGNQRRCKYYRREP